MDPILIAAIGVLVALAVLDLWVGVANDAVNFTNSAIGSVAASRRTILIVASIGVVAGALFSGGMMEVARKGVFDPGFFYSADGTLDLQLVLILYLGVMVADVVMLDLFNTLGLPTSTTVSIVSDLLGASLAVMFWKTGGDIGKTLSVINGGPVLGIYSGIFSSVIIAFVAGGLAMYAMRFLFTRDIGKTFNKFGWLWSGLSIATLTYFIIFKGMSVLPGLPESALKAIRLNAWPIMGAIFAVTAGMTFAFRKRHETVMRVLILAGTMGLAMSFAANDLVNFIGPTVAAGQAVFVQGINLSGKVPTPWWALFAAGFVMTVSLWMSRKAHTVTDTEVRLAASGDVEQRWESNRFSRTLVRGMTMGARMAEYLVPPSFRRTRNARMNQGDTTGIRPPYDLLRASVNLTVAATLISVGTANKLPLSTTYITFMVAMGSSLADGAWESKTADRRVAGALNVIGGWMMTGILAAVGAFVFTSVLYFAGLTAGLIISVAAVVFAFWKMAKYHKRNLGSKETVYEKHFCGNDIEADAA